MTQPRILTSRDIGETENALRAILLNVLIGTGLDYPRWIALQLAALNPPTTVSEVDLLAQLVGGLKIDEQTARDAVADLQSRQMLSIADGKASATERGTALYQSLRDRIGPITRQLYADLSVEDLTTARRVLATILERANTILFNWSKVA